ncbi:PREDICTED: hemicentin-2 [Galeopterus variegatus]|uniref:Hemicentin-2 n=1 Tax=Galeopterus variegatus TaxID=482537 RepID=A0ABM0RH16_GALVR|nr:PREDICTED: hemicentin-2 [Galeopterus variegatus]
MPRCPEHHTPLSRAHLQMDDAGQYQCLAENNMGTAKKVVTLVLQSAPVFQVEPQDMTVRSGDDVALQCQATGEPAPTLEWLRAGRPLQASGRLQTQLDGSLWLQRVEAEDTGTYECVAHNLLGSSTARAFLTVRGEPRGSQGSLMGVINGQEFGVATLNTSVQQEVRSGVTSIRSSISHVPANVGPLMRVLVVTIAPIYWALAGENGEALNGHSLTGGRFRQESHVEFATGELLRMTQVARGLDPDGLLLLDMVINGIVPESLADADLQVQDFQEQYVQTGPGQLFVGSTQRFLQGNQPTFLRCNHSIQYDAARGPQPQLVQHLRASGISTAFNPKAEALRFQLTTALQAEENEVGCPEGFELDTQGAFCVDRDECSGGPSPCSHSCHNMPGRFACSCPAGFTLAWDDRNCRAGPSTAKPPLGSELCAQGGIVCSLVSEASGRGPRVPWDVDECAWDAHPCREGQRCVNLLGSYHCLPDCGPGFRAAADGAGCEDVDECQEHLDECHYNQLCENIPGGHRCGCPRGYQTQGPGLPCLDINECLQLPAACAHQCRNLQGGYRCLCPPGQTLLHDGKTCIPLQRSGQNETTVSHRGPFASWLRPRAPIPGGSYQAWVSLRPRPGTLSSMGRAWCPPGFIRQNGICTDLDECQVRNLCQHACRNTEGSYQCLCPSGYRLLPSGKNCQDINECEEDGIECGPSQMCFNTRGSYQCVDTPCPATYRQGSSPGVYTRRALTRAGLYRPTVRAAAPRHQSVFVLLIAVSPFPY